MRRKREPKYDLCKCGHTRQNHDSGVKQNMENFLDLSAPCKCPNCSCPNFEKEN